MVNPARGLSTSNRRSLNNEEKNPVYYFSLIETQQFSLCFFV